MSAIMSCTMAIDPSPKSFLGISIDTLWTILIPILIFFLGVLFKLFYDWKKERSRLILLRKHILYRLRNLVKPFEQRIKYLDNTANKIQKGLVGNLHHTLFVRLNVEELKNIPRIDLFKLFVQYNNGEIEKNDEHYSNIVHTLSFLDTQKEYVGNDLDGLLKKYERDKIALEKYTNNIFRIHDKDIAIIRQKEGDISKDEYMFKFEKIANKFMKQDDPGELYTTLSYLLDPIEKLCKENLNDERAIPVLENVVYAKLKVDRLIELRIIYSRYFNDHKTTHEEWLDKLKKSIHFYENSKYRIFSN